MPRTKFISGRSKTEQISSLTRIAVTRLAIGLIIAALIVIGLTSPSGAQINRVARTESTPSSDHDLASMNVVRHGLVEPWRTRRRDLLKPFPIIPDHVIVVD